MADMHESHQPLTIEQIEQFELEHGIKLSNLYNKFLQESNGGYPLPNMF